MKKTIEGLLCFLVLCRVNVFAQAGRYMPGAVHTPEKSQVHTPAIIDSSLTKIFSNLGPPTNAYNDSDGFLVAGTASGLGQEFIGVAFTPAANSTVTDILAALKDLDEGTGAPNQINLTLYGDEGGVPGFIISGPHTIKNLSEPGTCCELASWHLDKGISVRKGNQYWVVADAPASGTGSDSAALWETVFPLIPEAINSGTGWFQFPGSTRFGLAVLGTVP